MNPALIDTFLAPLLLKLGRVFVGKNAASAGRWLQTALGTALVTWGVLTPEALGDGFQVGEIGLAVAGVLLMLEGRVNNWLRGRTLYGINLSGASALIGRSGQSLGRWVVNILGAYLATVGLVDGGPEAIAGTGLDSVLTGVVLMLSTRLWSYLEARVKGELPEQLESRTLGEAFSVDGI